MPKTSPKMGPTSVPTHPDSDMEMFIVLFTEWRDAANQVHYAKMEVHESSVPVFSNGLPLSRDRLGPAFAEWIGDTLPDEARSKELLRNGIIEAEAIAGRWQLACDAVKEPMKNLREAGAVLIPAIRQAILNYRPTPGAAGLISTSAMVAVLDKFSTFIANDAEQVLRQPGLIADSGGMLLKEFDKAWPAWKGERDAVCTNVEDDRNGDSVKGSSTTQTKKDTKGKNIQAKMSLAITRDLSRLGLSAEEWAKLLDCHPSTITKSKYWLETIAKLRSMSIQEATEAMKQTHGSRKAHGSRKIK